MIVTRYRLNNESKQNIAIVADLHEHHADEVIKSLREIKPDVIAVPGDLFERHEYGAKLNWYDASLFSRVLCFFIHLADKLAGLKWSQKHDIKKENAFEFLREANKIAPVLMSLGNHELFLTDEDRAVLSETGTTLLSNSSVEVKISSDAAVVFGGIPSKQSTNEIDFEFLKSFHAKPGYKILLCHHPEYYKEVGQYADLILSGHCHGGQIRVLRQGVFAPGQGLFPKYHHGEYTEPGCGTMIVSSGCCNTASIPRWGNPCEVVVVEV